MAQPVLVSLNFGPKKHAFLLIYYAYVYAFFLNFFQVQGIFFTSWR